MSAQGTAGRGESVWARTVRAADSVGGWLLGCAVVAALGFWFVPGDYHDRGLAQQAQELGSGVGVVAVQVHVDHESGKGGGWYEVDHVRVRLPDEPGWRDLDAVANEGTLTEEVDWDEGWQEASAQTGYALPLTVRVVRGPDAAVEAVVAERDVAYWTTGNHDPEIGMAIGFTGVLAGAGGLVFGALTDRRRPAQRHGRSGRRAARRWRRR